MSSTTKGEIMKFCISTGCRIAYERLLDPGTAILLRKPTSTAWVFNRKERWVNVKGESITIEKMEEYILQPDQIVDVLFAPNA